MKNSTHVIGLVVGTLHTIPARTSMATTFALAGTLSMVCLRCILGTMETQLPARQITVFTICVTLKKHTCIRDNKYYLQHKWPCCIRYTSSSRRRALVYLIQHGHECCKCLKKRMILSVYLRINFQNKPYLSRENQS